MPISEASPDTVLDEEFLNREFRSLGLPEGAVVMVHASLSAFGPVRHGAHALVRALRRCVGPSGTVVAPTFTPQVRDPHPHTPPLENARADEDRRHVPFFHDGLPTSMGAVSSAVLALPERVRGRHPQVSVAAVGPLAAAITAEQPLQHAFGPDSPFERMYELGAHILLLGVGHNRNSFLHHAESRVPWHRTQVRRFPYEIQHGRVWVETPDVAEDNGRFFSLLGAEAEAAGLVRSRTVGSARCLLMESGRYTDFAAARLAELLAEDAWGAATEQEAVLARAA
ncbi:aminoglycoside N(3)-acetyltransferase [Streptomyces sp. NPDC098789]|uniref:aminoglycoside N(3)-acetyltransferase n=1 Tax=Streptomyces sp. NPDC098789 TaxID=3366098 RepID=UPI0038063CBE